MNKPLSEKYWEGICNSCRKWMTQKVFPEENIKQALKDFKGRELDIIEDLIYERITPEEAYYLLKHARKQIFGSLADE